MLLILQEFPPDPILSIYVIDDVWDYMKAIKVCLYMTMTDCLLMYLCGLNIPSQSQDMLGRREI